MPSTPPEKPDDHGNESFGDWSKSQVPFIIVKIVSYVLAAATFIYYVTHGEEKLAELASYHIIESWLFCLNLIFCIFCVIKLQSIYLENTYGEFNARKVYDHIFQTSLSDVTHNKRRKQSAYLLRRFKLYFLWFWIMIGALYAVFTIKTFEPRTEEMPEGKLVKEEKRVVSLYMQVEKEDRSSPYYKFTEVVKKPVLIYGKKDDLLKLNRNEVEFKTLPLNDAGSWLEAIHKKWDAMLAYWLNTISIMFILWCFSIMAVWAQHPSSLRKLPAIIRRSPILTGLLVALYPALLPLAASNGIYYEESLNNYTTLFDAISGLINGVVLALFIARLDSKFISLPSGLIGRLYLYSAIQPLFVVFDAPGVINAAIKIGVLLLVFILKIHFFFIITYAIQEGKIFAYLYCFSTLNERVEAFTKNYYIIKALADSGHITFNITLNKNELFKGHGKWSKSKECEKFIRALQKAAADSDNYHLHEIAGANYIVIKDADGTEYCRSAKPVNSQQEFLKIRDDACCKLPYCAVDLSQVH